MSQGNTCAVPCGSFTHSREALLEHTLGVKVEVEVEVVGVALGMGVVGVTGEVGLVAEKVAGGWEKEVLALGESEGSGGGR